MADVRSLLRSEQALRRISHPNLSYTKSGLLNCMACSLLIKSESLWEGHLRSANHKKNLLKAQNGSATDGTASKKRKLEDDGNEERKKTKQEPDMRGDLQAEAGPTEASEPEGMEQNFEVESPQAVLGTPTATGPAGTTSTPQINEDEWAAFEREVVPLTHQPLQQMSDYASATISAAPVTAAELAAQTNAEKQQRREAEVEDEKAEEETRLVEEFEVMEGLEERVKRLKEKRETLRLRPQPGATEGSMKVDAGDSTRVEVRPPDASDEDDSDEVDEWGF